MVGRQLGILAGSDSDAAQVTAAVAAAIDAGLTPLVIADTDGPLGSGDDAVPGSRTLLSTRSIEFDAIIVAAGRRPTAKTDLLISEAFRHAKALGAWDDGDAVIEHAGCPADAPGVVVAGEPADVVGEITMLLARHRVWDRVS